MQASTASLAKNCAQLCLLIYTLPPYLKVELIIVQYTTLQITEQQMYFKGLNQHYTELDQVDMKFYLRIFWDIINFYKNI